jgi:hypothetical protein
MNDISFENSNKFNDKNTLKEIFLKDQTYKDILKKKDLWKELESRCNGKLKMMMGQRSHGSTLELKIPYKNQIIVLTETDTMPLKIEIELCLLNDLEFSVYLKDWTDKIAFALKRNLRNNENTSFDKKYMIKSNKFETTLMILDNKIKELLVSNNIYSLIFKKDKKTENHKLLTVKDRVTDNITTLSQLVELEFQLIDNFINQRFV